jgi:hypothetical protein
MDLQLSTVERGSQRSLLKIGAFACFCLAALLLAATLVSANAGPI